MFETPAKNRIAQAFKELLLEKPFSTVKVKNIVERAGVSSMTFYRHFSDKFDMVEGICHNDLMLFAKIYGDNAELRSMTVCMLNTIKNNRDFYVQILGDDEARESFMRALSRVSSETTGTEGSPAALVASEEILKNWAKNDFSTPVDDVYMDWVSTMPLRSVLKGKELAAAVRAFEQNTIEDFKKRMKK